MVLTRQYRSVGALSSMSCYQEGQAQTCGSRSPEADVNVRGSGGRSLLPVEEQITMTVSGLWFHRGKDATLIRFFAHAGEEACRVDFGPCVIEHEAIFGSVRPKNGAGYQLWVPLEKGPSWGLAVGFNHTNTSTETLKT